MISHDAIRQFVYETGSPFKRLEALLDGVQPNPALAPITMTVGEPRHTPPDGVLEALIRANENRATSFRKYPAINGTPEHRRAIADWITARYDLAPDAIDPSRHVLPLNGSREGLVMAARTARDLKRAVSKPVIVMQNPFYQAYAAGALMAECDVVLLDDDDLVGARIAPDVWERVIAAYIASPTNPQGVVLTEDDWGTWINRARLHDFYLFADECYSEIYRDTPPPGVLQVAAPTTGRLRKVVSFNSLSKRSNLPGLRCGFVAGDEDFLATFLRLRIMGGPQVPIPLESAATTAWRDESHVRASRGLYARKWELVEEALGSHLGEPTPRAGFFLWLKLPGGLTATEAAMQLWRGQALRTIPGDYISYQTQPTTGQDRLRLALVDDETTTREAMRRLTSLFA